MKGVICAVLSVTSTMLGISMFAASGNGQPASAQGGTPTYLNEIIPSPAYKLFQWPDDSILNGPGHIDIDATEVKAAQAQAFDWIKKVLSEDWLPPVDTQPVCIRSEFDGRDVIRVKYEVKGYEIQVSQTATIFTIKLSHLDKRALGGDLNGKINAAKDMCSEVFNRTGKRWTGQGKEIVIPELNTKIAAYSFVQDTIVSVPGDMAGWGRPQTMSESGKSSPHSEAESEEANDPKNPDWEDAAISWSYWFRNVSWWNDGHSIGFYFLKIEAGPWVPSYESHSTPDKHWFRPLEG